MKTINPYLSFNGQCEAAFDFYKSVFGGEFIFTACYEELPSDQPISDADKKKILHISLPLTEHIILMGSDTCEAFGHITTFGDSTSLSIDVESEEEARRLYKGLSSDGHIAMPLDKTHWADLYAMFTDKFGICWMINFTKVECESLSKGHL